MKQLTKEEKENKGVQHLQTEQPTMSFEDWWVAVARLFADAWGIDMPGVSRRLNINECEKWYKDGFTPYAFFRENYSPLY